MLLRSPGKVRSLFLLYLFIHQIRCLTTYQNCRIVIKHMIWWSNNANSIDWIYFFASYLGSGNCNNTYSILFHLCCPHSPRRNRTSGTLGYIARSDTETLHPHTAGNLQEESEHRQRNTQYKPTFNAKDTHTYTTTHILSLIHLLVKKYMREIHKAKMKIGVQPWHGQ